MQNTAGVVPRDAIHSPAKTHDFRGAFLVLVLGLVLSSCAGGLVAILRSPPGDPVTGGVPAAVREAAFRGGMMSAPSPPANLVAEGGDGMVTLTWGEPVDNGGFPIIGYNIYRGETSGGEELFKSVLPVTTYTDLDVTNGQTYYYQVTALNPEESERSNEAVATPSPSPTVPGPPQGLDAAAGDGSVQLTWSPPDDVGGSPITNYYLYRENSSGGISLRKAVGIVQSYSDTEVSNGVTYNYTVSAENAVGEGPPSNEASATPIGVPGAPQNLRATPGDGTVTLDWSAPGSDGGSAIIEYRIYRRTPPDGEARLGTVSGDVFSYTDRTVSNHVTYYYRTTAVNDAGESPFSDEVSATPEAAPAPPGPPQNLRATAGDATVTLEWSAPADIGGSPITNYYLYRENSSGGGSVRKAVGNVLSYSDSDVSNGVTYNYTVSAENDVGEGPPSNEASATPIGVPGAPQNLRATAGDATVTLEWSAPASDGGSAIIEYRIYRRTPPGDKTFLTTVDGNVLSHTDRGLSNGVTYYYLTSAVNDAGEGPSTDEVSAKPEAAPAAPGPPQNLRATAGDATVTLEWSPPQDTGGSSITNYNLYRDTLSGGETWYKAVGNVLSYSDNDVSNGVTYYYKVGAENDLGEGALSNEAPATPESGDTVPDAPRDLSAVGGDRTVTLAWSAPIWDGGTPILSYKIYRDTSPGGAPIATVDVRSFLDSERENGVTYRYRVTAVNGVGEGPPSNEASATPATVPGAPQELTALAGNTRVTIQWSGPESNGGAPVTNYRIYRGTTSGSTALLTTVESVTSYSDEGLTNDVTYYYRVSAVNRVDEGPPSDEVWAIPTSGPTVPNAPQSLVVTAGNGSVTLTWSAPVGDGGSPVLNYTVYRGLAADRLAAIAQGVTSHSLWNGGLTNGKPYYYAIAAVNAVGIGPRTAPVSAPTIMITSPASGATVSPGTIVVNGTASDDGGVARIEVSVDGTTWIDASGRDPWTATLTLAPGNWTIHARATDATGNVAVTTVSVSVTGTEGSGGTEPTPVGGGDPRPSIVLMAFLSFGAAGGIAWFVFRRSRNP